MLNTIYRLIENLHSELFLYNDLSLNTNLLHILQKLTPQQAQR